MKATKLPAFSAPLQIVLIYSSRMISWKKSNGSFTSCLRCASGKPVSPNKRQALASVSQVVTTNKISTYWGKMIKKKKTNFMQFKGLYIFLRFLKSKTSFALWGTFQGPLVIYNAFAWQNKMFYLLASCLEG